MNHSPEQRTAAVEAAPEWFQRRRTFDGSWKVRMEKDDPPADQMRRRLTARRAIEDRAIDRELGLLD